MVKEVAGTISGFGEQVLSNRPSNPHARVGTAQRLENPLNASFEFKLLGATSNGVTTKVTSGFGSQTPSRCATAPSHRFGNRYASDLDMLKESRPGPGQYESREAVGKQPLSMNPSQPTWKVGTGTRWSTYRNLWKPEFSTPGAGEWTPESGWLGDAPKYSFHGTSKRADITTGLPGNKPTFYDDPGPGMYERAGAMGTQFDSRKATAARTRVGTAERDRMRRTQYISHEHEQDLFGKHSPAPNLYNPTKSLSMTSTIPTPSSFRFGSGDRFSQVRPREKNKPLPGISVPGPGSYVV